MRWLWRAIGHRSFPRKVFAWGWKHRLKPDTKVLIVRGWRTALIDEGYQRICVTFLFRWED